MSIRLTKPWVALDAIELDDIPAQLGVFQVADADERILYIGYGGGRSRFGLRTAIASALERCPAATLVRYETTHGYLSRWEELLMIHQHEVGLLPPANDPLDAPRGRLDPGG